MEGIYIDSITESQGQEIISCLNEILQKMLEYHFNQTFYFGLVVGVLVGFCFWNVIKGVHKNDNR